MKKTVVALSCLTGVVIVFAAGIAGGGRTAAPTPEVPAIAVIRVVDLLVELSKAEKLGDTVKAEQGKAQVELAALAKDVETQERELTTLKPASEDFLKQSEAVAEKKAHFNAHRELLDRQIRLKQEAWSQKAYRRIAQATRDVAAEKGLALVLVKDDPDNVPEAEGIRSVIATQKVLYCDGCPDITPDVQARLSAAKP